MESEVEEVEVEIKLVEPAIPGPLAALIAELPELIERKLKLLMQAEAIDRVIAQRCLLLIHGPVDSVEVAPPEEESIESVNCEACGRRFIKPLFRHRKQWICPECKYT